MTLSIVLSLCLSWFLNWTLSHPLPIKLLTSRGLKLKPQSAKIVIYIYNWFWLSTQEIRPTVSTQCLCVRVFCNVAQLMQCGCAQFCFLSNLFKYFEHDKRQCCCNIETITQVIHYTPDQKWFCVLLAAQHGAHIAPIRFETTQKEHVDSPLASWKVKHKWNEIFNINLKAVPGNNFEMAESGLGIVSPIKTVYIAQ